jgi:hypothetical protein
MVSQLDGILFWRPWELVVVSMLFLYKFGEYLPCHPNNSYTALVTKVVTPLTNIFGLFGVYIPMRQLFNQSLI